MNIRTNVLILLTSGLVPLIQAQSHVDDGLVTPKPRIIGAMYADFGIPVRQFGDNLRNDLGIGFGGELLYKIRESGPVWGGAGVHSFAFDGHSLRYSQLIDGETYNFRERTVSRLFMAHGILRFQPELRFTLQPYVQGALGVHWFFTNTKIRDRDADEVVDRINESREAVLGFSLQSGVQIVPKSFPDLRADLRVGYYRNASVGYYRYVPDLGGPDSYPIDDFEWKFSAVDMLGVHVGLSVMISTVE